MHYEELKTYKPQIMNLFNSYGIENPRVFGSTVMGNARIDSDIDFLVNWPTRHNLFDRISLKQALEELLQQKVDLVTEKSLYSGIRDEVLETAKPL